MKKFFILVSLIIILSISVSAYSQTVGSAAQTMDDFFYALSSGDIDGADMLLTEPILENLNKGELKTLITFIKLLNAREFIEIDKQGDKASVVFTIDAVDINREGARIERRYKDKSSATKAKELEKAVTSPDAYRKAVQEIGSLNYIQGSWKVNITIFSVIGQ